MMLPKGLLFSYSSAQDKPWDYSFSNHITLAELWDRIRRGQRVSLISERKANWIRARASRIYNITPH